MKACSGQIEVSRRCNSTRLARARLGVQTSLSAYPDVVGVGCGQQVSCEPLIGDVALRVYVTGRDQVATSEWATVLARLAIHPTIEVIVHAGAGVACTSTPTLYPGDQIARDIDTDSSEQFGTLGLIVTKSGQTARYLLTNAHVLNQGIAATTQDLYKPHKTTCNKPAATVPTVADPTNTQAPQDMVYTETYADPAYPGLNFKVDAALASINAGVKSSNVNPDISSNIPKFGPTLRDLVSELALQPVASKADVDALNATVAGKSIKVQKFGAKTGWTTGQIIGACLQETNEQTNAVTYPFMLVIKPLSGYAMSSVTNTYDSAEATTINDNFHTQAFPPTTVNLTLGPVSNGKQEINLSGSVFCDHGDSGSILLDMQGQIVGLVHGNTFVSTSQGNFNLGFGLAQYIVPVFDAIGLTKTAAIPPGAPQSGMGTGQIAPHTGLIEESLVDAAERTFGATAVGARLVRLVRLHLDEIQRVLHHRRRGVVAWHRNKGPAFVAAISRAVRSGGRAVPQEIDGVRIGDALRRIGRVLSIEGSSSLQQSLDEHGEWLIATLERATEPEAALRILLGVDNATATETASVHLVNIRGTPGTVSALVRCEDGLLRCLTNHHVLFGRGAGAGDGVFAVDESDGSPRLIMIGTTARGHIGRVMHFGSPVFVDCALVTLGDPSGWPASLKRQLGALPVLRELRDPSIGGIAMKEGVATGHTTGRIVDIAYPDRPFIDGRQYDAPGQLLVQPVSAAGISTDVETNFCAGGDSGAVILDAQGHAIGLLWGSNANGEGIACPIRPVLAALGIEPAAASAQPSSPNLVEA
jgi:hypothetical protein